MGRGVIHPDVRGEAPGRQGPLHFHTEPGNDVHRIVHDPVCPPAPNPADGTAFLTGWAVGRFMQTGNPHPRTQELVSDPGAARRAVTARVES